MVAMSGMSRRVEQPARHEDSADAQLERLQVRTLRERVGVDLSGSVRLLLEDLGLDKPPTLFRLDYKEIQERSCPCSIGSRSAKTPRRPVFVRSSR